MKTIFYFTADWCNPCKKMKPIAEEINREYADISIKFIDADAEIELAKSFGIRSVPTLILMDEGNEVRRIIGAKTKNELMEFING
jgi:thioredoxin 1